MSPSLPPRHTFGDNQTAGDRLDLLAEVFGPTSAALLRDHVPTSPSLALDLGCGPGQTTRLLGSVCGAARTVGLERSAAFVERATRAAPPGVGFVRHDVAVTPFPVGPAGVIFARYLLAHLSEPLDVAARWATQLTPGGRLILEEVQDIDTSEATFARYLDLAAAMLAARSTDLYIGRALSTAVPAGTELVTSRAVQIAPATGTVARLFSMNLQTWRDDGWVSEHVDPSELVAIATRLRDLDRRTSTGAIVWTHRQVVLERS